VGLPAKGYKRDENRDRGASVDKILQNTTPLGATEKFVGRNHQERASFKY